MRITAELTCLNGTETVPLQEDAYYRKPHDQDSDDTHHSKPHDPNSGESPSTTLPTASQSDDAGHVPIQKGADKDHGKGAGSETSSGSDKGSTTTSSKVPLASSSHPGANQTLVETARKFIPAILDPKDNTSVPRLWCPTEIDTLRYGYLRASASEKKVRYFFAINLRQVVHLMPRLMGSVLQVMKFLGPTHCALSIVEGNSDDGTYEVLQLLKEELDRIGVRYYLTRSKLNPSRGDRIEKLALLRATALAPITGPIGFDRAVFKNSEDPSELDLDEPEPSRGSGSVAKSSKDRPELVMTQPAVLDKVQLIDDATVIFLNDVAACAEDILELIHQRDFQEADMTCAMDWHHTGDLELFYDVWISRAANGDLFFDIPANGSWDHAKHLFFNEPVGKARFQAHRPLQVFACWNGATAFSAKPIVSGKVNFRPVLPNECFQGEPQLFCKDMWWAGYGKIAVVPSINLEYTDELGARTKKSKGYVRDWVAKELQDDKAPPLKIDWKGPPPKVKCMPTFDQQTWKPWNETLVDMKPTSKSTHA